MSERDLNRAVAHLCGEAVDLIQTYGFWVDEQNLPCECDDPLVIDWDKPDAAYLGDVLSDEDWPGRVSPLPSYDEDLEDEFDEEYACAAA